ncbi:MAG: TrmH family RNA methyltransferase [Chloroflexota bacterium]
MTVIESTKNPRLRAAAALRDRRERDRQGLTLVDGVREVRRAVEAGVDVAEAFVDVARLADADVELLRTLRASGGSVHEVAPAALARIAFGDRSDGVVAVVRIPETRIDTLDLPPDPLVVVVEDVEKPGNLGAIVRSADGAGVDAVVVADPLTDVFNPNTIRASLGTVFGMRLAAASSADVRRWLTARQIRVIAARVDAAALYTAMDLTGPVAIVLGSEAEGLSSEWSDPAVIAVRLPMLGRADSLNVSVAAAVLLYEARRQRGLPDASEQA